MKKQITREELGKFASLYKDNENGQIFDYNGTEFQILASYRDPKHEGENGCKTLYKIAILKGDRWNTRTEIDGKDCTTLSRLIAGEMTSTGTRRKKAEKTLEERYLEAREALLSVAKEAGIKLPTITKGEARFAELKAEAEKAERDATVDAAVEQMSPEEVAALIAKLTARTAK